MRYLSFFQQDVYDSKRFLRWIWEKRAFDKRGSVAILIVALFSTFFSYSAFLLGACAFLGMYFWEEDPRKYGKLKLVMTNRAKRIYFTAFLTYVLCQSIAVFLKAKYFWPIQIILIQSLPLFLVAAVSILSFDERKRQRHFIGEAMKKLDLVSPYIIGITGSYGKTSTKNALGSLLNVTLGGTFWPKDGTNTDMGITREIRQSLKKGTRYAVIEMGAYARGSIARLCSLTPPQAGIITTVGVAHIDRFGDHDTIREAKSELAQAIPFEGILVCNGDNEGTRKIASEYPKRTTLLYGYDNSRGDLDCWIKEYHLSNSGTAFFLQWKDKIYRGHTSLMGKAALSNLTASFAMVCALGADPEYAIGAIANLKPVDNRLQVYRADEITYLRDAYNSNPEGFSDALDVLEMVEGKKKYLMTPGMVELGTLEKALHEKIGNKAGRVCDYAIVVGETNRESLTKGLIAGGMGRDRIIHVEKREQAFSELESRLESGDVVLIENDLPDLYQDLIRF